MKKILLLLSLMLLISGCSGSVKSTEVKQTEVKQEYKVVYATGHRVNFAQFIEYIEDGETVEQFAKRIYQVNKNIMSYNGVGDSYTFIDYREGRNIIIPVKKKK